MENSRLPQSIAVFLLLCLAQKKLCRRYRKSWNKQTFLPRLSREVAYHSHQMDAIKDQFLDSEPYQTEISKTEAVFHSNRKFIKDELQDANYWWRNLRNPVLFSDALDSLLSEKPAHIIQVGPNPVLANDLLTCVSHSSVVQNHQSYTP